MFEVIIASDEDQDPRRRATPRPARRRRTAAVPKHLQNELGRKFPYRLRADAEGYEIHYRRGGWTALIGDRDQAIGLRVRETFAWIVRGDDKAQFGRAVFVLDEARRAGIAEVSIETSTSTSGR